MNDPDQGAQTPARYLLTAQDGEHERHFDIPAGPLRADLAAVGLAYEHMRSEGLKEAHLFVAGQERWLVRLTLP